MSAGESKKEIRQNICRAVAAMDAVARAEADRRLVQQGEMLLADLLGTGPEDTFLGYMPLPDEPGILPLLTWALRRCGAVLLPRIAPGGRLDIIAVHDLREMVPGPYGIREPSSETRGHLSDAAAVLVPGRAFTPRGERLGRGGGFYDRLLDQMPNAFRLALAYDEQILDAIPLEPHDQPVHAVLTPTRLFHALPPGR